MLCCVRRPSVLLLCCCGLSIRSNRFYPLHTHTHTHTLGGGLGGGAGGERERFFVLANNVSSSAGTLFKYAAWRQARGPQRHSDIHRTPSHPIPSHPIPSRPVPSHPRHNTNAFD